MSIMIPDLKVYSYLMAGIKKAAYNSQCDEFYSHTIRRAAYDNTDTEKEADRLTRSWLSMNEDAYDRRYGEESDNLAKLFRYTAPMDIDIFQLLKYAHCVQYQIEPEYLTMTAQREADLKTLEHWINDMQSGIIHADPRYNKAQWCN